MASKQLARVVPDVEVLGPEELEITRDAGKSITSFVAGVVKFFVDAGSLEKKSKGTLMAAKALAAPTNSGADEVIQKFVKRTTTETKAVEEHWKITSIVHQFHKRLVACRQRATAPLEEAARIANGLHNAYVQAETRRAALESDRLRQIETDKANKARQKELDDLELEALKAERGSVNLSEREQLFAAAVAGGRDAVAAATHAGYRDPKVQGPRLLEQKKITKAIEGLRAAAAIREQSAAVAAAPVHVDVPDVKPDVTRAAGATDRSTHTAEILDVAATVEAFRSGKYGIPGDLFTVDPVKANEYARSLHERLNLWPGLRYKKNTKVV